jgi:general secretion pathway protein I
VRRRQAGGFTLLEVMVALAIVSIGLVAAFNAIIQMAHSTSTLRERAMADWIAMNQITEIRISGEFPAVGRSDGDTRFADREWRWEASIAETGVTDLRRIDLSVARAEFPDDPVTIMTGFVSRATGGMVTRIDWWGAGVAEVEEPPVEAGEEEVEEPTPRQPRLPRRPRDGGEE